jgi:serine protease Do
MEFPTTLGEFPREQDSAGAEERGQRTTTVQRLGFSLEPLTDELAQLFGHEEHAEGVVVTDVSEASPAWRAGVRPGQLVVRLEGTPVFTVQDVARVAAALRPGEVVSLRVLDPELGETIINFRSRR